MSWKDISVLSKEMAIEGTQAHARDSKEEEEGNGREAARVVRGEIAYAHRQAEVFKRLATVAEGKFTAVKIEIAHCRTKRETVFHYIMSCEAYRDQRTQLRKEIPNTLFTFTNLISRKEYIPKLLEYVEQTDRLSHTFTHRRRERRTV